jgi:hypothetical protein
MPSFGLFPYIDAADKAVTSQSVAKGDSLDLDVKFNNSGDINVSIAQNKATYQIVNNATGSATTGVLNSASGLVALAGKSIELGTISDTMSAAGSYTIIVKVEDANEKVYEAELSLKVLNTDASVSAVKVKGVTATGTTPTFAVELPFGTDLTKLAASDVKVTATDSNAKVGTATIELGTEDPVETATIKVTVTAEDGETKVEYTINVTIAEASDDSSLKSITVGGIAQTVPGTPGDIAVNLPAGTTETPVVVAVANHAGATVVITPATDVTAADGTANVTTIVVTAENDSTSTYTITFTVLP